MGRRSGGNESWRQAPVADSSCAGLRSPGHARRTDPAECKPYFRRGVIEGAVGGLRFGDFAAANAGSADAHALGSRAHASVHRAQIHVPAPLGDVMGVADAVTELRLLAADITLMSHDCCRSFQRPLLELLL